MTGHNQRSSSATVARRAKRGFSLIEAAIVLGVVGAVIGTIWVAAANMYENYKVNKTVGDLRLIVQKTQNLISFRDAAAIDGGGIVDITTTLRDAGVFPKDWVNGDTVKTPFGGPVTMRSYYSKWFMIDIWPLSRSSCSKLLVKISSLGAVNIGSFDPLGLNMIQVNYPSWGTANFPVSLDTAKTVCQDGNWFFVYFGYNRNN